MSIENKIKFKVEKRLYQTGEQLNGFCELNLSSDIEENQLNINLVCIE